jgi:transposase-like protein
MYGSAMHGHKILLSDGRDLCYGFPMHPWVYTFISAESFKKSVRRDRFQEYAEGKVTKEAYLESIADVLESPYFGHRPKKGSRMADEEIERHEQESPSSHRLACLEVTQRKERLNERIRAMWRDGIDVRTIAKALDCDAGNIRSALRHARRELPSDVREKQQSANLARANEVKARNEQIKALSLQGGHSVKALAKQFGLSKTTICSIIRM